GPHSRLVLRAQEDLHSPGHGWRPVALVVKNELDPAEYTGVTQRHFAMLVPSLHHALIHGREVDLTEADKVRIVLPQHVEDGSSLVWNPSKRDYPDPIDLAQTILGIGTGTMNRPPFLRYSSCCAITSSAKFQLSRST